MQYNINKGVGTSAEFKGLKAQYLFIFAIGLLSLFIVFVIMSMLNIDRWFSIGFTFIAASALVWLTFYLNRRYGEHGIMKQVAKKQHPRFLINRISMYHLLKKRRKETVK